MNITEILVKNQRLHEFLKNRVHCELDDSLNFDVMIKGAGVIRKGILILPISRFHGFQELQHHVKHVKTEVDQLYVIIEGNMKTLELTRHVSRVKLSEKIIRISRIVILLFSEGLIDILNFLRALARTES